MKYFFVRLIPPRPNFPADITAEEAAAMQQHVVYWKALMARGKVLAFGPVMDPRGSFGLGLLRMEDGEDPAPLAANDPTVLANLGFSVEVSAMPTLHWSV